MDKQTPSSEELVEMMVTSWRKGAEESPPDGPVDKPGGNMAETSGPKAPGQVVRREFYAGDAWSLWAHYASRGIILDKST